MFSSFHEDTLLNANPRVNLQCILISLLNFIALITIQLIKLQEAHCCVRQ